MINKTSRYPSSPSPQLPKSTTRTRKTKGSAGFSRNPGNYADTKAAKAKARAEKAAKAATEKGSSQKTGEGRTGVAFNPEILAAPVGCTNAVCGVVVKVETLEKLVAKKKQYIVTCDVAEEAMVKVATLLRVDEGQLVVVALLGSLVGDSVVGSKDVGGHVTTGRLCDTSMLGWKGGDSKTAATLPKTFAPGDSAPEEAPGRGSKREVEVDKLGNAIGNVEIAEALVAKPKLSKEDKKIAALEARAAREARKKKGKGGAAVEDDDDGAPAAPRKASKLELAKLKKAVKAKRDAGEEVYTDDELEAAGFLVE